MVQKMNPGSKLKRGHRANSCAMRRAVTGTLLSLLMSLADCVPVSGSALPTAHFRDVEPTPTPVVEPTWTSVLSVDNALVTNVVRWIRDEDHFRTLSVSSALPVTHTTRWTDFYIQNASGNEPDYGIRSPPERISVQKAKFWPSETYILAYSTLPSSRVRRDSRLEDFIKYIASGDGPTEEWLHKSRDTEWLERLTATAALHSPVILPTKLVTTTVTQVPTVYPSAVTKTIISTIFQTSTKYATTIYRSPDDESSPLDEFEDQTSYYIDQESSSTWRERYSSCWRSLSEWIAQGSTKNHRTSVTTQLISRWWDQDTQTSTVIKTIFTPTVTAILESKAYSIDRFPSDYPGPSTTVHTEPASPIPTLPVKVTSEYLLTEGLISSSIYEYTSTTLSATPTIPVDVPSTTTIDEPWNITQTFLLAGETASNSSEPSVNKTSLDFETTSQIEIHNISFTTLSTLDESFTARATNISLSDTSLTKYTAEGHVTPPSTFDNSTFEQSEFMSPSTILTSMSYTDLHESTTPSLITDTITLSSINITENATFPYQKVTEMSSKGTESYDITHTIPKEMEFTTSSTSTDVNSTESYSVINSTSTYPDVNVSTEVGNNATKSSDFMNTTVTYHQLTTKALTDTSSNLTENYTTTSIYESYILPKELTTLQTTTDLSTKEYKQYEEETTTMAAKETTTEETTKPDIWQMTTLSTLKANISEDMTPTEEIVTTTLPTVRSVLTSSTLSTRTTESYQEVTKLDTTQMVQIGPPSIEKPPVGPEYWVRMIIEGGPFKPPDFQSTIEKKLQQVYLNVYLNATLLWGEFWNTSLANPKPLNIENRTVHILGNISSQHGILNIFKDRNDTSSENHTDAVQFTLYGKKTRPKRQLQNFTDSYIGHKAPEINIKIYNSTYYPSRNETEIIYAVFDGETPIPAAQAVKSLDKIIYEDMTQKIGYKVRLTEEYLSSSKRSTWQELNSTWFLPTIIGVASLLVLVLLGIFCLAYKTIKLTPGYPPEIERVDVGIDPEAPELSGVAMEPETPVHRSHMHPPDEEDLPYSSSPSHPVTQSPESSPPSERETRPLTGLPRMLPPPRLPQLRPPMHSLPHREAPPDIPQGKRWQQQLEETSPSDKLPSRSGSFRRMRIRFHSLLDEALSLINGNAGSSDRVEAMTAARVPGYNRPTTSFRSRSAASAELGATPCKCGAPRPGSSSCKCFVYERPWSASGRGKSFEKPFSTDIRQHTRVQPTSSVVGTSPMEAWHDPSGGGGESSRPGSARIITPINLASDGEPFDTSLTSPPLAYDPEDLGLPPGDPAVPLIRDIKQEIERLRKRRGLRPSSSDAKQ